MSFKESLGELDPSELLVDRISSLPCDVLGIILQKLPLFDAVRTCILAKDWRYKWLMLSAFLLDYENLDSKDLTQDLSKKKKDLKWDKITSVINSYLLNHVNSIKLFYLRTFFCPHYSELYHWLLNLSNLDLEVLLLEELGDHPFKIPSYMFHFKKLKSLFLGNCTLRIPSTFGGFSTLLELCFRDVAINDDDLHNLILGCPMLAKLTLLRIYGLQRLRINSPTLTMLEIDARIEDVAIESSECLVLVCIKNAFRYPGMVQSWRKVIQFLSGLMSLQRLVLFGDFIMILAADYALEKYPLRNDTLTRLTLYNLRFETVEVLKVCLSLLSSGTNIKNFQFTIEAAKGPTLITTFLKENCGRFSFPQLDSISVKCPGTGMGCALKFIEFLCAHSPNLKYVSIVKKWKRGMHNDRKRGIHNDCVSKITSRFIKINPHIVVKYEYRQLQ